MTLPTGFHELGERSVSDTINALGQALPPTSSGPVATRSIFTYTDIRDGAGGATEAFSTTSPFYRPDSSSEVRPPPKPQDQGQNRVRAGSVLPPHHAADLRTHAPAPPHAHTSAPPCGASPDTRTWSRSSSRRSPRHTRARASPARNPAVHGHLLTQRPVSRHGSHFFKARYPLRYPLSLHTAPEGSSRDPDPPWGARGSAQSSDPSGLHSRRPHSAIPPAHLPLP